MISGQGSRLEVRFFGGFKVIKTLSFGFRATKIDSTTCKAQSGLNAGLLGGSIYNLRALAVLRQYNTFRSWMFRVVQSTLDLCLWLVQPLKLPCVREAPWD